MVNRAGWGGGGEWPAADHLENNIMNKTISENSKSMDEIKERDLQD